MSELDDRLIALEGHWGRTCIGNRIAVWVEPTPNLGLHILTWPLVKDAKELESLVTEVERLRALPMGNER